MSIKINDLTPKASELKLAKIEDIYGNVIVVRGWA